MNVLKASLPSELEIEIQNIANEKALSVSSVIRMLLNDQIKIQRMAHQARADQSNRLNVPCTQDPFKAEGCNE